MKYEDLVWESVEGSTYKEAILELDENITLKIIKLDDDSFKVTYLALGKTSETNLKQLEDIMINNDLLNDYFKTEEVTKEAVNFVVEEIVLHVPDEPYDRSSNSTVCVECINEEWRIFYDKLISFWEADNFWVLDETSQKLYYDLDHRAFANCTFQIFKNNNNSYEYRTAGVAFQKAGVDKFITGNHLEALEQFALASGVDNRVLFIDYYKHVRK